MKREITVCDTCGKGIAKHDIGVKHVDDKDYHADCVPLEPEVALERLARAILEDEPNINTAGNMEHYDFLQQIKDKGRLSHKASWAVNYLQTRFPKGRRDE